MFEPRPCDASAAMRRLWLCLALCFVSQAGMAQDTKFSHAYGENPEAGGYADAVSYTHLRAHET